MPPGLVALGSRAAHVPAGRGVVHMARLLAGLSRLVADGAEPFSAALARVGPRLPRHGVVIAVSDFYDDDLALPALRRLARAGHDVVAVQTLADEEQRLTVGDDVELVDAESGQSRPVGADAARDAYTARLTAWRARLRQSLLRDGIEPVSVTTADRARPRAAAVPAGPARRRVMGIAWLLPAAWWLGALVAVPVAVHLLARQRRRPLRFPTLRFIEAASAPSRRHWRVRDPGLLAVRSAILLAIDGRARRADGRDRRPPGPLERARGPGLGCRAGGGRGSGGGRRRGARRRRDRPPLRDPRRRRGTGRCLGLAAGTRTQPA